MCVCVVSSDADLIVFAMRAGHGQVDVLKVERDTRAVVLSASKFKDAVTDSCPHVEQVTSFHARTRTTAHAHMCAKCLFI